jgi:hypothetical protein
MNKKNDNDKLREQKSVELFNNFLRNIPQDKVKFDEFTMLEEITNAKIDYNIMKDILDEKIKKLDGKNIKTIKDI